MWLCVAGRTSRSWTPWRDSPTQRTSCCTPSLAALPTTPSPVTSRPSSNALVMDWDTLVMDWDTLVMGWVMVMDWRTCYGLKYTCYGLRYACYGLRYACYGLSYGYGLTHLLWIEIHLLWTAFDLVVYTVDCVTSRTLIQLLACGLVTCVLSWCSGILNVWFVLRWPLALELLAFYRLQLECPG